MIKNYLTIFFLSSTTLFSIVSCKKHQATPPNTFTVTIHDTVFNASIVSAVASKSAPEVLIIGSVSQPVNHPIWPRLKEAKQKFA